MKKTTRLNRSIRASELRIIDEDGSQLGIMSLNEAIQIAESRELDLVEISPEANPPVAKIMDWGKYNYQKTKQLQKSKRNSKTLGVKQIRLSLKIGEHDLGVKTNKISKFIEDGHKVKVAVIYKGRENAHKDLGFKLAAKVIESLGEEAVVDQEPQLNGRQLIFVLRSTNAKAKNS